MHDRLTRTGHLLALATVSLFIGSLGCTINAPPPATTEDPTSPATTTTTSPATTTTATSPAPTTTATTPAPTTTATAPAPTTTSTAPAPTTTSTAPAPAPNAKCTATSTVEVEPNNTAATANSFGANFSFCGSVTPGDVDFVVYHAPNDLLSLSWSAAWTGFGTPAITVTVVGATYAGGQTMPVLPGQDYVFEIAGGSSPESYAIALTATGGSGF